MSTTGSTRTVLHSADIARALTRISHEILESNKGPEGLVLLALCFAASLNNPPFETSTFQHLGLFTTS